MKYGGKCQRDKRFRKRTVRRKWEIIDFNNNEITEENNMNKFPGNTSLHEYSKAHNNADGPPTCSTSNPSDSHTFSNAFECGRIFELST